MAPYRTLLLDQKTIENLAGHKEAIASVEKAFKLMGEGKAQMPAKVYIHLGKYHGDFRAMPAYIEGFSGASLKWVNVHPGNRKKDLPTVMALLILSDPRTGFPLCVMDATYITALRTAAAGGVAAKYLARKNSRQVAIIGCGVQARYQLLALQSLFSIHKITVTGIDRREMRAYQQEMQKATGIKIATAGTIKECVREADIIVTATPSRKPLVRCKWLKKGVHINAIGADAKGKQELDADILSRAKIVVDAWEQAAHSGEINVPLNRGQLRPKDVYADIGEIITGRKKARTSNTEMTVFDSTGLAVQDLALANLIYRKAVKLKHKRYFNFI